MRGLRLGVLFWLFLCGMVWAQGEPTIPGIVKSGAYGVMSRFDTVLIISAGDTAKLYIDTTNNYLVHSGVGGGKPRILFHDAADGDSNSYRLDSTFWVDSILTAVRGGGGGSVDTSTVIAVVRDSNTVLDSFFVNYSSNPTTTDKYVYWNDTFDVPAAMDSTDSAFLDYIGSFSGGPIQVGPTGIAYIESLAVVNVFKVDDIYDTLADSLKDTTELSTQGWVDSAIDASGTGYPDSGSYTEMPKAVLNTELFIGNASDTSEADSQAVTIGWANANILVKIRDTIYAIDTLLVGGNGQNAWFVLEQPGGADKIVAQVTATAAQMAINNASVLAGRELYVNGEIVATQYFTGGQDASFDDVSGDGRFYDANDTVLFSELEGAVDSVDDWSTNGIALADSTGKIDTTYTAFTTYVSNHGGGLTSQSVKHDHVDSTAENFVMSALNLVTSAEADSSVITKQHVKVLIEDSLNEYSLSSAITAEIADSLDEYPLITAVTAEIADSLDEYSLTTAIQTLIADSLDEYSLTTAIRTLIGDTTTELWDTAQKAKDSVDDWSANGIALSDSTGKIDTTYSAFQTYVSDHASGLTDQSVKATHVDSTGETFIMEALYKVSSAFADSQVVTKKYVDDAAGGLTTQSVKHDHVDSTAENFIMSALSLVTSAESDSAVVTGYTVKTL
ncbi:MAG: hypothetical protein ACYTEQ_28725, partial [Planctomycetota bacterium]